MTADVVNGDGPGQVDLVAIKQVLLSSSTKTRISQLRIVEDKISQNGMPLEGAYTPAYHF